jgi:hypothetical protein
VTLTIAATGQHVCKIAEWEICERGIYKEEYWEEISVERVKSRF